MPRYVVHDHPKFAGSVVFDTYVGRPILMPGTGNLPEDDHMTSGLATVHAATLNRVYDLLHPIAVQIAAQ